MLFLAAAAFAQEPTEATVEEVLEEATEVSRALAAQVEALAAELEAASTAANVTSEELAHLQTIHGFATVLADGSAEFEWRLAAATALAKEDAGVVFVVWATKERDLDIARGAVWALAHESRFTELGGVVRSSASTPVREEAIQVLIGSGDGDAGEVLYDIAADESLPRSFRGDARDGLERYYPEVLEGRGEPVDTSATFVGVAGMTAGNGLAGGILLSSVGVWGRSDEAVGIGAFGGALIGSGTGALYGVTQSATSAQGLRYASDVSWGLTQSELLTQVVLDPYPIERGPAEHRARQNKAAALRALGVTAGAGAGLYTLRNSDPNVRDVFGSNVAGVVGTQIGFGLADMLIEDGPGNCYPFEGGQGCDAYKTWYRSRYSAALVGSGAGLGMAWLTRDTWNPGWEHHLFSGLAAGEVTLATALLYETSERNPVSADGLARTTASASFALGEVYAHYAQTEYRHDAALAYSIAAGNALGAGVPLMFDADDEPIFRSMAATGLLTSAAGVALAPRANFSSGDVTLITVGTPILTAQASAYAGYLDGEDQLSADQVGGVALSSAALSSAGLGFASQHHEPTSLDIGVIGTGAVWGAWYGVITPIALELDGPEHTLLLTGSATSQAFMLGTAGVIYGGGMDSRRLLIPQLGAVAGATFGSLGVSLVNPDGADIAKGALVGSIAGFASGGLIENKLGPRKPKQLTFWRPDLPIPGRLSFAAAPSSVDGEMGVYAQLDWRETR